MNTLPKAITGQFFPNTASFEALQAHWSDLCRAATDSSLPVDKRPRLSAAHDTLYAALRGKDYRKGFTPISNAVKLSNGQDPQMALKKVITSLQTMSEADADRLLEPFGGLVTVAMLCALRELLPQKKGYWWDQVVVTEALPGVQPPVEAIPSA